MIVMANHNMGQVAQLCICYPGLHLAPSAGQKTSILQPGRAQEQTRQYVAWSRLDTSLTLPMQLASSIPVAEAFCTLQVLVGSARMLPEGHQTNGKVSVCRCCGMTCLSKSLGEPAKWCELPAPWSPNICRCTLASEPAPGRSLVTTTTRYCVPTGCSPRSSSLQVLLQCSHARRNCSSQAKAAVICQAGSLPAKRSLQHSHARSYMSFEQRLVLYIGYHPTQQLAEDIPARQQSFPRKACAP